VNAAQPGASWPPLAPRTGRGLRRCRFTVPVAAAQPGSRRSARGCRRSARQNEQGTGNVQPRTGPTRCHDPAASTTKLAFPGSCRPPPTTIVTTRCLCSRLSGPVRAGFTTVLTCSDVLAGTTRDRRPTSGGQKAGRSYRTSRARQRDHHTDCQPARPPRHVQAGRRPVRGCCGADKPRGVSRRYHEPVLAADTTTPRAPDQEENRGDAVSEGRHATCAHARSPDQRPRVRVHAYGCRTSIGTAAVGDAGQGCPGNATTGRLAPCRSR
jgi:hypothetical protein